MFGQTYRLSRQYRELTSSLLGAGIRSVPFPPDGIAFYSKNSAVSHRHLIQPEFGRTFVLPFGHAIQVCLDHPIGHFSKLVK